MLMFLLHLRQQLMSLRWFVLVYVWRTIETSGTGNHFVYVICKTAYVHNLALTLSVHQCVHHPVCDSYLCVCMFVSAKDVIEQKLQLHFLNVYSQVVYLRLIASLFCFLFIYSYISSSQKRQRWKVVNGGHELLRKERLTEKNTAMVTLGSFGTLEMRYLHINKLEKHRVGGSVLSEEGNALRTKVQINHESHHRETIWGQLLGELVFS